MNFSLACAGEIVYTTKTERKLKMATGKETAGETAKNEPKADTHKAETPNQEAPKVEVKTIAVPKEIALRLQEQRLDIAMLSTTIKTLIGMCNSNDDAKILTKHGKVCVEVARAVSSLMVDRYNLKRLEMIGMASFLANEIVPMAAKAVDKAEADAAKPDASKKKEVK